MIKSGNKVTVHYTGKFENGVVFDTSIEKEPIEFEVGAGQVIPGFDNAVVGMKVGEKKTVNIKPEQGYGEVNKEMIVKVAKDQVPEGAKVGDKLQGQNQNGQPVNVVVKSINEDSITLDANHELSGKTLEFEIEVVDFK
jgi:FKBP-type peptidyl-prolyl cis-trans isomerase 2